MSARTFRAAVAGGLVAALTLVADRAANADPTAHAGDADPPARRPASCTPRWGPTPSPS